MDKIYRNPAREYRELQKECLKQEGLKHGNEHFIFNPVWLDNCVEADVQIRPIWENKFRMVKCGGACKKMEKVEVIKNSQSSFGGRGYNNNGDLVL